MTGRITPRKGRPCLVLLVLFILLIACGSGMMYALLTGTAADYGH